MEEYKRHRQVFTRLRPIANLFCKWFLGYEYDSLAEVPEPYLLLSNHNTDLDPVLIGLAAGHQIYFVSSEHIMRKKLIYRFLDFHVKPIIHQKGKAGLKSSIEMLRRLKAGHCVCLFPEGNRSFNGLTGEIPFGTAKLAKKSGVPLVTYRFEGGYFSQPRWGSGFRKGRLFGKKVGVYSPEQLKGMTDEEVAGLIERDLSEDAAATQKRLHLSYKGHHLAERLESVLFACPGCGSFSTLSSKGNTVTCSHCHSILRYNVFGALTDGEGFVFSVTDLDAKQRERLQEAYTHSLAEIPLFNDAVQVLVMENHSVASRHPGILTAYKDKFSFETVYALPEDIEGLAIYSRNVLVVHLQNGKQLEIRGSKRFNAYKYLLLYGLMTKEQ